MIPAYSYNSVCDSIVYSYRLCRQKRMVALLFARPNSPLAKEILPNPEYFHHRSGKIIDFFCSGYGAYWRREDFPDKIEVAEGQGFQWSFSEQKFDLFRREIQSETKGLS